MQQSRLLPMMVRMNGRRCLVVGGGHVAERKIASLLDAGAVVSVVSPACTEQIKNWSHTGRVLLLEREYVLGEGEDAFLIVAATDQREVNELVALEAEKRGQLVNAAAEPELGSVILPAVLKRGRLTVAVSSSGASPAAAVAIRDRIDEVLGEDAERLLDFLERFRREAKIRVPDAAMRRQLLKRLASNNIFTRLSTDGWQAYETEMLSLLTEAELVYKNAGSIQETND